MNTLVKRDRALLEYLINHYGKETLQSFITEIKQEKINIKNNNSN